MFLTKLLKNAVFQTYLKQLNFPMKVTSVRQPQNVITWDSTVVIMVEPVFRVRLGVSNILLRNSDLANYNWYKYF